MNDTMTIRQCADRVGVPPSTLRYYEREGLIPDVPRDRAGHRVYDERLIRWTIFLTRLRSTGMPIRTVKAYVRAMNLGSDGDETRMGLLAEHRARLLKDLTQLNDCLAIVERKLEIGCGPR